MATNRFMILLKMFMFIILAAQLSGCAAVIVGGAVGAGTVVYIKGEIKEDINVPASKVYRASVSALKALYLPLIEDTHDNLTAKIKSKFADGKDVWINIESLSAESSQITIRVGIFGDENKERTILDKIHNYL